MRSSSIVSGGCSPLPRTSSSELHSISSRRLTFQSAHITSGSNASSDPGLSCAGFSVVVPLPCRSCAWWMSMRPASACGYSE